MKLVLTCTACPEQYEAFIGERQVGYLRLRYGTFTARCPNAAGDVVYEAEIGDGLQGSFSDERERRAYLKSAKRAIRAWLAAEAR